MAQQRPPTPWVVTGLGVCVVFLAILSVGLYRGSRSDQTIVNSFHRLFYDSQQTWLQNRWLGLVTYQNPNDVWIIQEIIAELKPDFIVETGTMRGGSAVIWAMILREVNPTGRVISIDIEDQTSQAKQLPIFQERVDFLHGSSTDSRIVGDVRARVDGKSVVVILDSLHDKNHVLKEMQSYAPVVSVGSYLIVQDSNLNGHPVANDHGPGPMEAIDAFLTTHPNFESDRNRERLLFTMHPRGYLKRVK